MATEHAPRGFVTGSNPLRRQGERIAAAIAGDLTRRWKPQ